MMKYPAKKYKKHSTQNCTHRPQGLYYNSEHIHGRRYGYYVPNSQVYK